MIDIKELRIGNLVSTNGKPANTLNNGIYKVLAMDSRDSLEELKGVVTISCEDPRYRDVGAWCQYLEPIPLTPELLEKCGFEHCLDFDTEWHMKSEGLSCEISSNEEFGVSFSHDGYILIGCKYLHQLQNMYYAITGEELEVNL